MNYKATGKPLDDHEREMVTILAEEAAEVIQSATKMLRFGKDDCYPGTTITNSRQLGLELGDLLYMAHVIRGLDLTQEADVDDGVERKRIRLAKYAQTEKQS
jgi:hypothetical protein